MRDYLDIIIAPVESEKSRSLGDNVFTFKVKPSANKSEIKKAVEKIFKVDVLEVRTSNYKPKDKKRGIYRRYPGKTKAFKKAAVTLKPGQTIALD